MKEYQKWLRQWTSLNTTRGKSDFDLQNEIDREKALRLTDKLYNEDGYRHYWRFKSAKDFLQELLKFDESKLKNTSSKDKGYTWTGSESFEEAVAMLTEPSKYYQRNIRNIRAMVTEFMLKHRELMPIPISEYDVTGNVLDMNRYLDGLPEPYLKDDTGFQETTFVKIIVSHNHCPASTEASDIERYARNVCAVTQSLMLRGVSVAIDYADIGQCQAVMFPIKGYTEPLDILALYSVLHPSFFRRIIFRAIEASYNYQSGYGSGMCNVLVDKFNKLNNERAIALYANQTEEEMIDQILNLSKERR